MFETWLSASLNALVVEECKIWVKRQEAPLSAQLCLPVRSNRRALRGRQLLAGILSTRAHEQVQNLDASMTPVGLLHGKPKSWLHSKVQ